MKAREECDKRHMDMDLGESVIEKGLGGLAVGGLGGKGSQGNMANGQGLLRRKASVWRLRVPAVRVWLVQKLPGTSHLVDVEVRRRKEGAAHGVSKRESEGLEVSARRGVRGGKGWVVRLGKVLQSEIPARKKKKGGV